MRKRKQQKVGRGANTAAPDNAGQRAALVADAGGFDWGWPRLEAAAANLELVRRLSLGKFSGLGYGFWGTDGPPFLALVGGNLDGMRSVIALIKEWAEAAGPNALQLEILLDAPGYVVALSQQGDLLRWRLSGLDTAVEPIVISTSVSKPMETQNPFLKQLAKYAREPIAPVILTVAVEPSGFGSGTRAIEIRPDRDNAILLPGLDIFERPEDRPLTSMLRPRGDKPELQMGPPDQDISAPALAVTRRRRLMATFPKTLQVLRHRPPGKAVVESAATRGSVAWQIEQAICNLRVSDHLAYEPSGKTKRLSMIDAARPGIIESASAQFDPAELSLAAIHDQIVLDAGFLLRRLEPDLKAPEDLALLNRRLAELGYV